MSHSLDTLRFSTSPITEHMKWSMTMNVVVVQGVLKKEPVERTLPAGNTVMDWSVSVEVAGKKWLVPVQWNEPSKAVRRLGQGDAVVVLGAVQQRFFQAGGSLASRTDVVGELVAKPSQRVATRKILDRAREALTSGATP